MVKISDFFFFFNVGVNYEQSKTKSICSKTSHISNIFKILLSPTNEYEKTKSKFL